MTYLAEDIKQALAKGSEIFSGLTRSL